MKGARKVGGAGRIPTPFVMFALSQFSGPDYLGAWKRLGPPWGQENADHCREVAVVVRFKQEPMYGLSAQKVAVVESWSLVEVRLY